MLNIQPYVGGICPRERPQGVCFQTWPGHWIYWSAGGEAPLARHQRLLREERPRWERFDLRHEIPILQLFFSKSCEFSCFGGPSGRHSEHRNGRNDIILAYLTRGSSISFQQKKNFNLSATYLIRMAESWCRDHLSRVVNNFVKKWGPFGSGWPEAGRCAFMKNQPNQ